jgi:hypothetical protein
MKTLKFRPHLVEQILAGTKTVTWRLFDDKDVRVGDKVEFLNWETKEKFCEVEITAVKEKKLGEIEEADFNGQETFKDKEEMLQTYQKYYGEKVNWETIVKIINFKIL